MSEQFLTGKAKLIQDYLTKKFGGSFVEKDPQTGEDKLVDLTTAPDAPLRIGGGFLSTFDIPAARVRNFIYDKLGGEPKTEDALGTDIVNKIIPVSKFEDKNEAFNEDEYQQFLNPSAPSNYNPKVGREALGFGVSAITDPLAFGPALLSKAGRAAEVAKGFEPEFNMIKKRLMDNRGSFDTGKKVVQEVLPELNEYGMYSKLEHVIKTKMGESATPEQLMGMLKSAGVKQEEIENSLLLGNSDLHSLGLVSDKGKVNKKELLDHIENNKLRFSETDLTGEDVEHGPSLYPELATPGGMDYRERVYRVLPSKRNEQLFKYLKDNINKSTKNQRNISNQIQILSDRMFELPSNSEEYNSLNKRIEELSKQLNILIDENKANAQNYNEGIKNIQFRNDMGDVPGHYDIPGTISHSRISEFLMPEGKGGMATVSAEGQSDAHQGLKRYLSKSEKADLMENITDPKDLIPQERELDSELLKLNEHPLIKKQRDMRILAYTKEDLDRTLGLMADATSKEERSIHRMRAQNLQKEIEDIEAIYPDLKDKFIHELEKEQDKITSSPGYNEIDKKIKDLEEQKRRLDSRTSAIHTAQNYTGYPELPMKNNWHEYQLKRELYDSAKNGDSHFLWDTGETHIKRANKSLEEPPVKDTVVYDPKNNRIFNKDNPDLSMKVEYPEIVFNNDIYDHLKLGDETEELAPKIRKQLFDAIRKGLPIEIPVRNPKSGSGFIHHYNKVRKNFVENLTKKFGVEVGEHTLSNKEKTKVLGFEWTPELRKHVLKYGFPIYMLPFLMQNQEEEQEKPTFNKIMNSLNK